MNRYHKMFLESKSSENVVGLFSRYKGAAKEITESWGMLEAAKNYFPDLSKYLVVVVGDGCSPRTGILFSFYTKAKVISVDPNFNLDHWNEYKKRQESIGLNVQRIELIKGKIEDIQIDCENKFTIVIWPHSHAPMMRINLFDCFCKNYIALPCCVPIPETLMRIPHIVYSDKYIETQKRIIHIWKDLKI